MSVKKYIRAFFSKTKAYDYLKSFLFVICFGLFVFQVHSFFDLYMKNATVMGVTYEISPFKFHPSVTFCPEEIFKSDYYPLTQKELDQISFETVT